MSASISMKQKSVGMDFLKQTAGILTGATGAYISDVMPVTTSTLSEAKSTISAVSSAFINTSQSILPKMRQLKTQTSFRSITNWFMEKEDDFDGMGGMDAQLDFDIDTESATIAEAQITEFGKGANQISQAVVESSHKMVESQLAATANLMATAEKQTAVISAGFDKTNETLNKILEVLTKNTSTLIETAVANNSKRSANDEMVSNGKFNLSEYKKIVAGNFKNSELGMMASMVPALLGDPAMIKQMLTPTTIVQMAMGGALNKAAPNLKKNMAALDKVISDTVMTSLIRLGENNSFGFKGQLARMFGIDSSRKNADTSRSSLELKTVPFDSIAHESITNAIPGYLRKILVAVGGEDVIYDYRSRSFRTKSAIHKDFRDAAATKGSLYGASDKVRGSLGSSQFSNMVYDMMMTELGSRTSGGHARQTVEKFGNRGKTESYILDTVLKGLSLSPQEIEAARKFAAGLGKASSGTGAIDIMNQVGRNNVNRNMRTSQYIDNANAYNVDLSGIRDSVKADMKNIAESYGKQLSSDSSVRPSKLGNLTGVNYTNMALYEIYRKLNDGINVYQVGKDRSRREKFKSTLDNLPAPQAYKPKPMGNLAGAMVNNAIGSSLTSDYSDKENLLRNQQLEDGTTENLTGGQRFARWGKNRGGNLARAMFSGSPEQVTDAIGIMIRDVGQVAGDGIKKGAAKINESSGNFAGYLKHKITGAGYKYLDDDGKEVEVEKNDKGGVLGYFNELIFGEGGARGLMKKIGSSSSKWFKSIAGYFNYGGNDPDEQKVVGKRKRLLGTSVGAMLGMGMLGGPLGIIMGGIAGSAMAQTEGLGGKIKNILFGDKDHQGDKRKDRNKRRGLIGRAVDGIVDPIRYQIGKTMTTFASVLKKNILGPLSNIGYAIKERMSNAAGGVVSRVFGGIFKGAAGMLKKMILLPLNIARAPISMLGMGARGAAEGGGAVAGSFLNSIAGAIGGKSAKAGLKDRIKSQKNDARIDKAESGFFGDYDFDYVQDPNGPRGKMMKVAKKTSKGRDYKTWKAKEEERRDKMGSIDEYTKDNIKDTAESTSEISKDMKDMKDAVTGEIIPGSSFKSHDAGVHDRLDRIINVLTGGKIGIGSSGGIKEGAAVPGLDKLSATIKQSSIDNERDSFSTGAIAAAAQLAGSGDEVTDKESSLTADIIDNAAKPNSNKGTIAQKLKDLMGIQKKKSDSGKEEGEKKKNILERIFDLLGGSDGILGKIGAVAGGVAALLGAFDLKSFWNDVVKGDMDFSEWWGEKSSIGKAVQGVMDISKFIGKAGGTVVNGISRGIGTLTKMVPFLPPIEPPQIDTNGPFAGISTAILGGLYLKGASAIGSIASAAASLMSAGSNIANKIPGVGKYAGLATGAFALGGSLYGWSQGGYKHDQTDASGAEIIDQTKQGAFDSTSLKYIGHTMMGTVNPISGKSSLTGAFFKPNGGSVLSAAKPPVTSMTSSTGKLINKVDDVWRYADSGRAVSAANLAKATPNASTVANAADSKGAIGFVTKALTAIKNFLMKNKVFKAFANTIGKKIDDVITTIVRGGQKIFQKFANKVVSIVSRGTVKEASGAATLGIGYAVMAFGGALSGGLSAANIFGVREADVNGIMRTVASVIVAMLNGVPGLWALELVDLVLQPLMGTNIRSILCSLLYNLLGGSDDLTQKQETFGADLNAYNEQFGASLGIEEYNDMANKGMMAKIFGYGATKTDENGRMMTDEGGHELRTGHGIAGWVSGSQRAYVKDSTGAVIRDENNKAIQAVDKYGNGIKKDTKWGDRVGNFVGGIGRFFTGGTEYETDENGQAIYDPETGEFKVKEKKGNIFQRGAAAISGGAKKVGNFIGGGAKKVGDFIGGGAKKLVDGVKGIGSGIAKGFNSMVEPFLDLGGFTRDVLAANIKWITSGEQSNINIDFEKDPLSGIKHGIYTVTGLISKPIGQIAKIGRSVFDWLKGNVITPISDAGLDTAGAVAAVVGGQHTVFNSQYWDVTQPDPSKPMSPVYTTLSIAGRMFSAIPAMVGWVGNKTYGFLKKIVSEAPSGVIDAKDDIEAVSSGKMTIFNGDYWKSNNEEGSNPLGIIGNISGFLTRLLGAPGAMVGWTGSKVMGMLNALVSEAPKGIKDAKEDIDKVSSGKMTIFNGDYWKSDDSETSNPLGIIANISGFMTRLLSAPGAMVGWVGSKAVEGFKNITTGMSSIIQQGETTIKSAEDGNISIFSDEYWKAPEIPSGSVLGGVAVAATYISKVINLPSLLIAEGFNKIKNIGKGIKDWWNNLWGKADEEIASEGGTTLNQGTGGGRRRGVGGARITGTGGVGETFANSAVNAATTAAQAVTTSEEANTIDSGSLPSPFIGSQFQFSVPSSKEDCDYGPRTLRGAPDFHTGIDLAPTGGDGSIGAVAGATVTRVSNDVKTTKGGSGYGNFVEYQLPNGIKILNGHMSPNTIPSEIKPGATLKPGDKIGKWGTTGNSTGNHLHFEARKDEINDGHGGHSFDPAPLLGMGTVSDTGSYSSPSPGSLPDFGSTSSAGSAGADSSAGPLAQLMSTLSNAGTEFMNKITGGLFGGLSSSSSSGSSGDGFSTYGDSYGSSGTCASAADFLRLCAAEIGNTENPPNSNKTKYGKWYGLDGNAWCMMFVQWCFNQAGLTLEHKSASCYETRDWWQSHHPDRVFKQTAKPGDIVIFNFSHTGIVESDNGSTVTTIEGNTSPDDSGSQSNGGCVARKKRDKSRCSVFIRPVDFEKLSVAASSSSNVSITGDNSADVFKLLKAKGLSDYAAAGIMGNLEHESGLYPDRVQGDNPRSAKSINYASGVDRGTISANDFINNGPGGGGFGLAQWTYPSRKKGLYELTKSRGKSISDLPTQVDYLHQELGSYGLINKLQSAASVKAASNIILHEFEKPADQSGAVENKRASAGEAHLRKNQGGGAGIGGSMPTSTEGATGIGGGGSQNLTAMAKITPTNFTKKIAQKATDMANSLKSSFNTTSVAKRVTSSDDEGIYSDTVSTSGTPIERIEKLLVQVVSELVSIESNTGTSSNLLNDLNGKDFVDKGLRDSLSNVGKNQKKSHVGRHVQQNNNNSRTIAAMARP